MFKTPEKLYKKFKDKGLKDEYFSKHLMMSNLSKIYGFGSVGAYYSYDRNYYNKIRHERDKKSRRAKGGLTHFEASTMMLWVFVELAFDGGKEEYEELRNKQAKQNYHQRCKENGLLQERTDKNRLRRNTDPEYMESIREKAREKIKRNPEQNRAYKKKWAIENREKVNNKYWKKVYGEKSELAKTLHKLELTIREKKKEL